MSDPDNFEALLAAELEKTLSEPETGDKVHGTIINIATDYAFVDLGGKVEGMIEISAIAGPDGAPKAIGEAVDAIVSGKDSESGMLLLGPQHGRKAHGLAELESAYRDGTPIEGHITGTVKGGLELKIAGQRAFCPASQADIRFIEDLNTLVGERFDFRITKFEGGKRPNIVVSRRALLEEERQAKAAELREKLQVGAALHGTVTRIKDFGAFVDLGGVEGMVHVSELAFGHVKHPSDVLSEGQDVEVAVLRIEKTNDPKRPEKIALSIRALAKDPWRDVESEFAPGTVVRGKVTRTQPFGAFVQLAPGMDGLVHVSELGAGRRVEHPNEIVNVGDEVEARVLSVDPAKKRISLSLTQTDTGQQDNSGEDFEAPPPDFDDGYRERQPQQRRRGKGGRQGGGGGGGDDMGTFGELLRDQMKGPRRR